MSKPRRDTDPANAGSKWSAYEENQLIQEITLGHSHGTIAAAHQRTVGSITAHILTMALREAKAGIDAGTVTKRYGITAAELEHIVTKDAARSTKKTTVPVDDVRLERLESMSYKIDEIYNLLFSRLDHPNVADLDQL